MKKIIVNCEKEPIICIFSSSQKSSADKKVKVTVPLKWYCHSRYATQLKITGETQEVCSDKRKPIEDRKERGEIEKIEEKEDRAAKTCQPWQPAGANFKVRNRRKNTPTTSTREKWLFALKLYY